MKQPKLSTVVEGNQNLIDIMAVMRSLWPEVSKALRRGHTVKSIHSQLENSGVSIRYDLFRAYVERLRQDEADRKELAAKWEVLFGQTLVAIEKMYSSTSEPSLPASEEKPAAMPENREVPTEPDEPDRVYWERAVKRIRDCIHMILGSRSQQVSRQ
jgi:Family of unknown function (DUF5338)